MFIFPSKTEVFSSKPTMFFDCIVKGVERIQYWMEIFVLKIQQNPATSYLVVIVIVVSVLFLYRHQAKQKKKKTAADFKHPNVAFYSNQIPSEPNGDYIDNILTFWKGDYKKLEAHHGYIQWLFPNMDMGVNQQAHPLTDEEAEIIRKNPELREKVKVSFKMMLDFYGMELREENKVVLADNATERLQELNQWGNHNFLRISRILLALKLLGHSNLMLPWMKHFADLIYVEKVLDHATASFEDFWEKNLDAEDRIALDKYKNLVK